MKVILTNIYRHSLVKTRSNKETSSNNTFHPSYISYPKQPWLTFAPLIPQNFFYVMASGGLYSLIHFQEKQPAQTGMDPPRQRVCYQTTCSTSKPPQLDIPQNSTLIQIFGITHTMSGISLNLWLLISKYCTSNICNVNLLFMPPAIKVCLWLMVHLQLISISQIGIMKTIHYVKPIDEGWGGGVTLYIFVEPSLHLLIVFI